MIYKNLKINHIKDDILTQYDSEYTVIVKTKLNRTFEKEFTIDDKALNMILKIGALEDIVFLDENKIKIKNNGKQFTTTTIGNPTFYFKEPNFSEENKYNFTLKELQEASKNVILDKMGIPQLKGVLVSKKDEQGNYSLAATDKYKLFYKNKGDKFIDVTYSIPTSFIKLLNSENVELTFVDNLVCAKESDGTILYGRLYSGIIPKVSSIINTAFNDGNTEVNITDTDYLMGVGRVFLENEDNTLKFTFKSNEDSLVLTYKSDSKNRFDAILKGEDLKIALKLGKNKIENNENMIKINNETILFKMKEM